MQDSHYIFDPLSEDSARPGLKPGKVAHKLLVYVANSECAKLVICIHVPIMLPGRSDSVVSRVESCAVAMLMCLTAGNKEAAA